MEKLDNILTKFILTDELRPNLCQPNDDGCIVATNAHILIKAPKKYFDKEYPQPERTVNYKAIIPQHEKPLFTVSLSDINAALSKIPLEDIYEPCPVCYGEGSHECTDCGSSHDCGKCDGSGDSDTVSGQKRDWRTHVTLNGVHFNPNFIEDIAKVAQMVDLNELTFHKLSDVKGEKKGSVIMLNDIMVVLMPVMADSEADTVTIKTTPC